MPLFFFFNDAATTEIYTLSLHDALPILEYLTPFERRLWKMWRSNVSSPRAGPAIPSDRKSTRLNSSHRCISYAVFCLKKKKTIHEGWRLGIGARMSCDSDMANTGAMNSR